MTKRQEENPRQVKLITQNDWNRQVFVLQAKGVPRDIAPDCVQGGFLAVASGELDGSVQNLMGLWHVASWRLFLNSRISFWGQRVKMVEPERLFQRLANIQEEHEHVGEAVDMPKSADILAYLVSDLRPRPRQVVEAYFDMDGSLAETAARLQIPVHKLALLLAEAERLLRRRWPNLRL